MITVNTVAGLASARPGNGDIVRTRGYSVVGTGENEYRYDRTSSATIDNVFVINGPGGRGRYIATDQERVEAAKAGCLFNGVADDTVAFQRAVDVGCSAGVPILLPDGTAIITNTITAPAGTAKFEMRGSGRSSTVINATALTNIPAIDLSDSSWTQLSNFQLLGDASSGHGIQGIDPTWLTFAYLPQHLQIEKLFITGFTGEQTMLGTSFGLSSPAGDKLIPACGIFIAGGLEVHIIDSTFSSNDIGLYLYTCGQPKVQRCVFDTNEFAGIVDQNNESPVYEANDIINSSVDVGTTFNLMINSPRRGALTVDAAGLVTLGSHGCVINKSKFKTSRVNIVTESDYAPVISENWIRSDIKTGILNYGPARIENNTFYPAFIAPKTFTTNFAVDDKLISNGHGFADGEEVILYSTGTLPAGLFVNTPLFVKTVTANDFEVSVTPGGASLDITSNGVGTHQVAVARREVWFDMPGATTCYIGSVSRNVFTYGGGGATHAHIQASSPAPLNPIDGIIEGNYFGQPYPVANTTRVNFNVFALGTVRALTVRDNVHHIPDGVTVSIRYIMPDNAASPGPQFSNNVNQFDGTGTIQFGDFFPPNNVYRLTASGRILNVVDFGADATGTTDSQVAIVTAVNNLQLGDELNFPAGTFLTSGNIAISTAGIKITGPGELKATGATSIILNLSDDTTVEGLHINGDGIAGYGIFIGDGVTGCKILRCRIGNFATAVAVAIGVEGDGSDNTVIEDNDIYDVIGTFSGRGISLIGATTPATPIRGVKVVRNRIDNVQGVAGGGDGIAVESWTATLDMLIDGNSITNFSTHGIKVESPGCKIVNNHIVIPGTTATGAIHAQTGYTKIRGNIIEGASGAIISLGPALNAAGNECSGNLILIPAAHGVASVDAIVTEGPSVTNVTISGNVVAAGSAIRSFVSFQGTGSGALVSGNTFDGPIDAGSAAIFTADNAPASKMDDVVISGNRFANVTGEYLLDDLAQSSLGIQWIENVSDGAELGLTGSTTVDLLVKGTFSGNPENALRGRVGSFITRSDGGSGTTGYLKEANSDDTGWVAIAAGGGGVSDGDKGDITVSGSGATWTIDAGVVTYAKMQDISATSRILGRITAGAGDVEELTAANVLTIIGVEAGADVTDSTNVDAAGAVMNADTSTAAMSFVIDEDNMASNSATKVPTQQSVKAYVDTEIAGVAAGGDGTFTTLTVDSATPDVTSLRLVNTANTVATAITNLPGGTEGQYLEIHVNDANTSFVNNSNLALIGGVNIPASSSPYIVALRRDATQWRQEGYASLDHQFSTSADGTDNLTLSNSVTDADINIDVAGTAGLINLDVAGTDRLIVSNVGVEIAGIFDFGTATVREGTGTPLGAVTANIGSLFLRTDGGTGTSAYIKEADNGASTGWVAIASGGGGLPAGGTVGDLVVNTGSGTGSWSSVLSVGANGATITGGTVTDPATPLAITQTWNDAADTFDGIDVNVTNTASAAASRLLNLRVGGTSQFSVSRAGVITSLGAHLIPNGTVGAPSLAFSGDTDTGIYWTGANSIGMTTAGILRATIGHPSSFTSPVIQPKWIEANTAGSGAPKALANPADSNKLWTNEGSAATNYYTLPTADASSNRSAIYTFVVQNSVGIRIVAGAGDTIRIGNKVTAAAGYVESTTIGDVITLVSINATEWIAVHVLGTWTDGTFTFTLVSST